MAAGKLYNLARMTTATTLTGTITLGAATAGYLSFSAAGVADGDVVSYGITDGSNSEHGFGTYTAAGTTLTRNVTRSTNSNAAISLSGSAQVFICPRAEDLLSMAGAQTFTTAEKNQGRGNISAVGVVKTQPFTSSGTYTPSTGMLYCIIECIGGGGGGGGVTADTVAHLVAGGGGSGGYSRLYASAATIGASKAVTIGAGGTSASAAVGGSGGATSVGTLCIANGGTGGGATAVGSLAAPGLGGTAGTGDVAFPGNAGGSGGYLGSAANANVYSSASFGAHSFFGAGTAATFSGAGNNAVANTGAGGSGAGMNQDNVSRAGGTGGSGYVVITEFCTQ